MYRQRLGWLHGYGARWHRWGPNCNADAAGLGAAYATGYEAGTSGYDMLCGQTSRGIAVDIGAFGRRLGEVVGSPELRRKLGEAGRQRARETFDWRVIFRR